MTRSGTLPSDAVRKQYEAVNTPGGVGLIDRSSRAALRLTGADRQAFLQGMVSNDVASLQPGQGCHAAFLDSTGHMLAELHVHILPNSLIIETDPRCVTRLATTLDKYLIMEKVEIADVSADWAILSVQGGGARAVLAGVLTTPIPELAPLDNIAIETSDGAAGNLIAIAHSRVGGYDLWLAPNAASTVSQQLVAAGAIPVGEEVAEILRVEAGIAAWGSELNESTLLPEAEIPDIVSCTKGCYIGQEIVARLHARGHTNRALRGILLAQGAEVPEPGDTINAPGDQTEAGRVIGRITSAVWSPYFEDRPLSLGYARKEYLENDTEVVVEVSQSDGTTATISARVLTCPFIRVISR